MMIPPITAIILAGGKGTRMGGIDKGLMLFHDKPIYQFIIDKLILRPMTDIMINANRNQNIYRQSGYPVFADLINGYLGPLAGIYSGLIQAKNDWVFFVSCDTPFIGHDIIDRLWQNRGDGKISYAFDGEKNHPTIMLIHKCLSNEIKAYLAQGERKLHYFLQQQQAIKVDCRDIAHYFININTEDELAYWNK